MADGSPASFSGLRADILLSAACVCVSAYSAGTTLGVLSFDGIGLPVVAKASDEMEREHMRYRCMMLKKMPDHTSVDWSPL